MTDLFPSHISSNSDVCFIINRIRISEYYLGWNITTAMRKWVFQCSCDELNLKAIVINRHKYKYKNGWNPWCYKLFTHRWYHFTLCRRKCFWIPINTGVRMNSTFLRPRFLFFFFKVIKHIHTYDMNIA